MVFKYISSFIYISVPGPRRKRSRCNNNTTMRMCVCVCVRENYNSNLRARRSSSCPSEAVQRGIFRKQYNNHLETFIEKEETTIKISYSPALLHRLWFPGIIYTGRGYKHAPPRSAFNNVSRTDYSSSSSPPRYYECIRFVFNPAVYTYIYTHTHNTLHIYIYLVRLFDEN
jgi:hypothetical protein